MVDNTHQIGVLPKSTQEHNKPQILYNTNPSKSNFFQLEPTKKNMNTFTTNPCLDSDPSPNPKGKIDKKKPKHPRSVDDSIDMNLMWRRQSKSRR